jgi:hypothetical protein
MRQRSPIADYLDALARELCFDPPLSRRVRKEVEDHLEQAAREADSPSPEAERRAIANFGDPRELARQYAASSLLAQTRDVGTIMILALGGIYVAMKGRIAWYALTQWELNEDLKTMNAIGILLDRYAFMLALGLAIIAWGYIGSRRAPAEFHQAYGKELRRCVFLCAAAAGALIMSVITETVLTGLRLSAAQLSVSALVPTLSLATELALAGVLLRQIRTTLRRAVYASSLLRG